MIMMRWIVAKDSFILLRDYSFIPKDVSVTVRLSLNIQKKIENKFFYHRIICANSIIKGEKKDRTSQYKAAVTYQVNKVHTHVLIFLKCCFRNKKNLQWL